ncbi:hypothetical protein [Ferviditalea candida]|uniref:Uncharacterized protein n=1 Tax=Ferviditalea candida TaxID=3108399 RepID=A0ABU5ZLC8_9BACL|nr:hypothetical protein [Paenibacillaceae bacterium T2]
MLRRRFDLWERQIKVHPVVQQEYRKIESCMEQLKHTLTPEQLKLVSEWEERSNWIQAKEKERLFYQGIIEGLQLWTTINGAGQIPLPVCEE